ncbi:hypothetical protein AHAS_Ahas19G0124400 [Arachis hypogaea]
MISHSSTEVKFRCLENVAIDTVVWLQRLLTEQKISSPIAPIIFCDNISIVLFASNLILHSRTKYFEVDLNFVRDRINFKQLFVVHIPSHSQTADVLTKSLSPAASETFKTKFRVYLPPAMSFSGCEQ